MNIGETAEEGLRVKIHWSSTLDAIVLIDDRTRDGGVLRMTPEEAVVIASLLVKAAAQVRLDASEAGKEAASHV